MAKNRGRQNTRIFEVKEGHVGAFLRMYEDLFIPYSKKSDIYKFAEDDIEEWTLRHGYMRIGRTFKCNLTPEGLREILSSDMFKKEKIRKGVYKYVEV